MLKRSIFYTKPGSFFYSVIYCPVFAHPCNHFNYSKSQNIFYILCLLIHFYVFLQSVFSKTSCISYFQMPALLGAVLMGEVGLPLSILNKRQQLKWPKPNINRFSRLGRLS
jgi:hypothetical protein